MKTFGKVLVEARRSAGIQQKDLAASVIKEDGIPISAAYLNDLEHDRRNPPSDFIIERLASALRLPNADLLYYFAGRYPPSLRVRKEADASNITRAYKAFLKALGN